MEDASCTVDTSRTGQALGEGEFSKAVLHAGFLPPQTPALHILVKIVRFMTCVGSGKPKSVHLFSRARPSLLRGSGP